MLTSSPLKLRLVLTSTEVPVLLSSCLPICQFPNIASALRRALRTLPLEQTLMEGATVCVILPTYFILQPTVAAMSINCSIDPPKRGYGNSISTSIAKMGVASRRCAPHMIATINLFDGRFAARTILPSALLHQAVQLQHTVTRMRRNGQEIASVLSKSSLSTENDRLHLRQCRGTAHFDICSSSHILYSRSVMPDC